MDPPNALRARLDVLEVEVAGLRRRLARLEELAQVSHEDGAREPPEDPAPLSTGSRPVETQAAAAAGWLALVGRAVLALAGAYLVRALTDAGTLSPTGGVALGLAYAGAWVFGAHHEALQGRPLSAGFQLLTSGLIVYPLLWEAAARFELLAVPLALALLVLAFAAVLFVAARHGLFLMAWFHAALAIGTALALLLASRQVLPATWALLALAACVERLAQRGQWPSLRWPAAIAVDGGVLVLAWLAGRPEGLPEGYPPLPTLGALAAVLSLPALYLVSVATRTLAAARTATAFEGTQLALAVVIGTRGALRLAPSAGLPAWGLSLGVLAAGALAYAVAFASMERRSERAGNFYFYSTAGLVLVLLGCSPLWPQEALALAWCAACLAAALLGRAFDRLSLRHHAAAYLASASVASGLLALSAGLLFAQPEPRVPPAALATLATALLAFGLLAPSAGRWTQRLPRSATVLVLACGLAGTAVALLAPLLGSPAGLAATRSALLAALAVGLAAAGRRFALTELGHLAYPVLALGGVKMLLQDLPLGRPAPLFAGFLAYGAALIVVPRLLRARG